jgi:hypothetical protein
VGAPAAVVDEELGRERVRALVAGPTVTGAPPGTAARCLALAQAAGLTVCEVVFAQEVTTRRWLCAGLATVPRLTTAAHVRALADHLVARLVAGHRIARPA